MAMSSSGPPSWAVRRRRRRRRLRQGMLWLLTVVTTGVLVLIAGFVKEISKTPTVARPAALSVTAHTTRHAAASASPAGASKGPVVADGSSGLSYRLLASPWQRGCPGVLDAPMFSWTAGEHAVAGQVNIDGTVFDWHGNACSGRLQQQFGYSGPADLESVTTSVVNTVDPLYYAGLSHQRTIQS